MGQLSQSPSDNMSHTAAVSVVWAPPSSVFVTGFHIAKADLELCTTKDDLDLLILPLPPGCWGFTHLSTHIGFTWFWD